MTAFELSIRGYPVCDISCNIQPSASLENFINTLVLSGVDVRLLSFSDWINHPYNFIRRYRIGGCVFDVSSIVGRSLNKVFKKSFLDRFESYEQY